MSQEEEDAVLATLQASLHDQSAYEEEVIREATHSLAPELPSLGFPSLESLSASGVAPPTQVHELLGSVRKQQRESKDVATTDLLCMKEQILLHYMETICGVRQKDDSEGGPSIQEQRRQSRRKQRLQKAPPESSSRSAITTAASASRNVEDSAAIPRRAVKRRKVQQIVEDDDDPIIVDSKERQAIAARRLERKKHKEARRQKQLVALGDENDDEKEEENEAQFDVEPKKREAVVEESAPTVASVEAAAAGTDREDLVDATAAVAPPLVCPLCATVIENGSVDPVERDALLAQHMQDCQSTGRRSRRARGNPAPANTTTVDVAVGAPRFNNNTSRKRTAPLAARTRFGPSIDDLEEATYEDRVDDWIENGLPRMKDMKERIDTGEDIGDNGPWQEYGEGFFVPAWIHRRLFGYQREGLKWMWGLHQQGCGGCLGDEMGLGKTVSIAAYLGTLIANRKMKSVLIIVPATMLQHWLKELAVWAPGLRRIVIHSSGEGDGRSRSVSTRLLNLLSKWLKQARKDRLYEAIDEQDESSHPPHSFCGTGYAVLTTYENVRRNPDVYVAHSWSYVILDEAQKIRNPDADVTVAVKRLRTPHRLCMSGTPIQNNLAELWSIFDFCFPSRLGTLPAFQQELADPIKRGGYSNASPMQVQLAYRCALVVRDLISPYLLRRTKKEVKEVALMPSKTEHVLFCRLSETQRSLYESYLRSDDVAKVVRGSANLLGAITMLRKICNHPDLVCEPTSIDTLIQNGFNMTATNYESESDEDSDYDGDTALVERSGKLEVLSKILPLWKKQGHRVLIFCQWRKMLSIIETFVFKQGWKFGRLDGNTNVAARQRLVDNFNQDESYFGLLMTTRTGGVGLNLTGANRILLYDPDWNPQTDAQARERAWRFGQEREVTIYRLITAGTVEEKIYQRQIFKTALSNRVLQDPRQRRLFSQRDLRDLFTLKADTGNLRSGGDGSTDTASYTQGIGVVDPSADVGRDDGDDDERVQDDNNETLESVMKSKGLAGIFDHHFVEHDSSRKSTTVREMEVKAKEVARQAAAALRQSVGEDDVPDEPPRFGGGVGSSQGGTSSKSLLASLRQQKAVAAGATTPVGDDIQNHAQLLKKIKHYVSRKGPSTDEILAEFQESVAASDVAIFRRLLKSVAVLQNGRWLPKS